jgi:glycosyltransferase involved in cell wall biosynthesis
VLARIKKHFAFDLIQSYGLFPDGYAAMKLGRIFGVPSLCTAVGRDITYWPYHLRGAMAASRETIQNLDQIIAVCDAQRQAIERFASPPHPVRVIFWGINPDLFARDEALRLERRAAVSAGPSDVILFYAGSLVRTKGVFELIAAFDNLCVKHSNLILILAGAGPDREDLERKATDLIASGALRLLGQVDPVHIPAWLHTADVFVFPSHSEGLSNAVCEAMAAGKAIVASAVGGHPEIIQDSQTGLLVPAKDTQALEEALERVISSEVLRQRLGMAARQHAVSILSMEKISEELHAVYHDVLSRGGRPGHCHEQSQA